MTSLVKIVVFVPQTHSDIVRKAMGDSGAGVVGLYSHNSFSSKGVGRFIPLEGSHPTIGKIGKLEEVIEDRVECVCERSKAKLVIKAIKEVHPYEEVAIDIYPLIREEDL